MKKDAREPDCQNTVSPGPTAMKNTFREENDPKSPQIDSKSLKMVFGATFNGEDENSVIDFEDEKDMDKVGKMLEDASKENYTLASLFAEKREKGETYR